MSVVAKTPNPFLANVSSYQKKLAEENARNSSLNNGKGGSATISMDGMNAGSAPVSNFDGGGDVTDEKEGSTQQDKLATFSTAGLSLEPIATGKADEKQQQDAGATDSDPESVVVEKPGVLSTFNNLTDSKQVKAPEKFFESPGLPNSSPAEERGMRPDPPADPFAISGSELSLEDSAAAEQAESKDADSDKPADRPGNH